MEQLGVVGLGKLGLSLAVLFSSKFEVRGVDINEKRIKQIEGKGTFFEPKINEYLKKYGVNLQVSTDYKILKGCNVVFVITQTPSLESGKFDLSYAESALRKVDEVNPECLAVISSTINIGDMDKLKSIHERVAYNPEFIKQGSIISDFENPKFILIGAYNQRDGELIGNIWRRFHDKPIHIVKPVEAEIIKLSLNVSFTLGITFANMVGELCEELNADSSRVLDVIYRDRRNYKAGLGYAGPCFPRDVSCFRTLCQINYARMGYELAEMLDRLNKYIVTKYVEKIKSAAQHKVAILGVSYKPEVPYVYESQPLKIAKRLVAEGYQVFVYDPLAEENVRKALGDRVVYCSSVEDCVKNADTVFVGTSNFSNIKTSKRVVNLWKGRS